MRASHTVGALVLALIPAHLFAVTISLGPTNSGITDFDFNVVGNTITINETWGAAGPGVLLIDDLTPGADYVVVKNIVNNTGTSWNRLANELLDPAGQSEDASDTVPYPAFVPAGYTTSNDTDGLSFAQGSGIPRVSDIYSSVLADELTDVRDFLDFFNGTLAIGASGNISFGLRENFGTQQPFLLIQRPNAFSRPPEIPEPSSMMLLGSGLAMALLVKVRQRTKKWSKN